MGLEQILEEIVKKSFSVEIREYESESAVLIDDVEDILCKHMNDKDSDGDLISRQALLEDFRNTITEQSSTLDWLDMIARQKVIQVNDGKDINVSTKDNDGWIPADERLPENTDEMEVTLSNEDVTSAWYNRASRKWIVETRDKDDEDAKVVAWKLHSEPYRPEKGEEK